MPADRKQKYIATCVVEKVGLFDDTSGFNVERIVKTEMNSVGRSEIDARSIAEKCAVKKDASETKVDWAIRGLQCLTDEPKNNEHHEISTDEGFPY